MSVRRELVRSSPKPAASTRGRPQRPVRHQGPEGRARRSEHLASLAFSGHRVKWPSPLPVLLARNLTAKPVHGAFWDVFVALLLNPFLVSYFHTTIFFKTKKDNFVEGFGGIYRIQRRAQDSGREGSRLARAASQQELMDRPMRSRELRLCVSPLSVLHSSPLDI